MNADTTWNLNITRVTVTSFTGGQFFIACDNATISNGTWKITNGQLNLNGGSEPIVYFLSSNTLTRQISEDLPGFQSTVFTKQ